LIVQHRGKARRAVSLVHRLLSERLRYPQSLSSKFHASHGLRATARFREVRARVFLKGLLNL
jgi:hypothetical protein